MTQTLFASNATPSQTLLDQNFTQLYALRELISDSSYTAATPRMTYDASGNLALGTTVFNARYTVYGVNSGRSLFANTNSATAADIAITAWNNATSGNNVFAEFGTETAYTSRGSITYNRGGGLVAYNTTSDYRAKDIIGPVADSGATVDALKPYLGRMKGATDARPMFIAHETQAVAPYAVTGGKDAVDAEGNPIFQQMDVSSLIPLLVAEIQSLRQRVKALEA